MGIIGSYVMWTLPLNSGNIKTRSGIARTTPRPRTLCHPTESGAYWVAFTLATAGFSASVKLRAIVAHAVALADIH